MSCLTLLRGTSMLGTRWKGIAISCSRTRHWQLTFGQQWLLPLFYSISHFIVGSVMSVTVTRYRMDTILPAFADCVQSLPNLHTLELCHVHQSMTMKLKRAFEGKTMPTIRTVVLPTVAHHILRSCPNVEDVTCNAEDGSQILGTIATRCPKVERISGMIPSPAVLKRLLGPQNLH